MKNEKFEKAQPSNITIEQLGGGCSKNSGEGKKDSAN